ncbi:SpoIIAA family protein [Bacillus solitudinis]|uniref:STAS/SEC14 domain-containing protein n=1 Tax=Bacillus solitudinis TaxID=2014074 RepID=UPI000C23F54D|nr:STAS/SEC14 domain-containing protein [Bacillus solitudinis]
MIAVKPNDLETVLEVVVTGKVTKEDMEDFEARFRREKESKDQVNVLLAVHEIEGYSLKALVADLKFSASHWKEVNKIAVFTDKKWIEFSTMVSNSLPGIEVKPFDFGEREQALKWFSWREV